MNHLTVIPVNYDELEKEQDEKYEKRLTEVRIRE